jgi:hypothetical protein
MIQASVTDGDGNLLFDSIDDVLSEPSVAFFQLWKEVQAANLVTDANVEEAAKN